jgi:putative membrane protein insertion efficiency factor
MKQFLLAMIRLYRTYISPLKRGAWCRFVPTCSEYATEAIETHGAVRGTWLAVCRFLRCNPLFHGGYDPVPPR